MDKNQWYQIQLFKKGKIEIFQNVFTHRTTNEEGQIFIEIQHSSTQNRGVKTVSVRNLSECYEVKILNDPDYEFKFDFPNPKDIEVKIHSTRKEVSNV